MRTTAVGQGGPITDSALSHSAASRTYTLLYWTSARTTLNPTQAMHPLQQQLKVVEVDKITE